MCEIGGKIAKLLYGNYLVQKVSNTDRDRNIGTDRAIKKEVKTETKLNSNEIKSTLPLKETKLAGSSMVQLKDCMVFKSEIENRNYILCQKILKRICKPSHQPYMGNSCIFSYLRDLFCISEVDG